MDRLNACVKNELIEASFHGCSYVFICFWTLKLGFHCGPRSGQDHPRPELELEALVSSRFLPLINILQLGSTLSRKKKRKL